jgi:hypothetical protein
MHNLINSFEQELTKHIIKVKYLLEKNWNYNQYTNKWYHNSIRKEYIENMTTFEKAIPHLYCNDKDSLNDFTIDEASRMQRKYEYDRNESWKQLEFNFDNEDFDVELYEEELSERS